MAFGFPAAHQETFTVASALQDDDISQVIASLGWTLQGAPKERMWIAVNSISLWSWGEDISVVRSGPDRNVIDVTSKCKVFFQCLDWGKNSRNVRALRTRLETAALSRIE